MISKLTLVIQERWKEIPWSLPTILWSLPAKNIYMVYKNMVHFLHSVHLNRFEKKRLFLQFSREFIATEASYVSTEAL